MEGRKKVGNKFGKRQHMGHWMEQWAAGVKTRLADKLVVFLHTFLKKVVAQFFKIWYKYALAPKNAVLSFGKI